MDLFYPCTLIEQPQDDEKSARKLNFEKIRLLQVRLSRVGLDRTKESPVLPSQVAWGHFVTRGKDAERREINVQE